MLYGGIEAGGTKFICAVGDENGKLVERIQIPTTVPADTMEKVIHFFRDFDVHALGIGSFGPIDIDPVSPTYGTITSTPKKAWRNYPMVEKVKEALGVPVGFHTDVNTAALGEAVYGAAKGLDSCLYMTVGTGIGAGAVIDGRLLQGLSHPEMGHILVRRHPRDSYRGNCPYHQDCLEGLAAGPAVEERWGEKGIHLTDRPEVWQLEGYYLAQALMQWILVLSPQKIILGGGVMKQRQIFAYIHEQVAELLNGYVTLPPIDQYIVPPGLGDDAGIVGSLLLAERAVQPST
ncbi:MAG: ROK family protein [Firmicutes bacterium]|uniref:fructokinase n=1 Tax=Melghirimyces thermohalophilus TaxID=1236220 RepID=A0A1G6IBS7_9BACL|nr:ROK family protein [Melghirimyces thermohalophilus]MDA8353515.1 ROK family protein [Bacillota bacterium]SDC03465.1 fructokinase [Melghirimyces thermohalophilus]